MNIKSTLGRFAVHEFSDPRPPDAMAKRILVTGATGNQGESLKLSHITRAYGPNSFLSGGSVAKLLLQHPEQYRVRALTRNPDSPAARHLSELGAEVVQGDLTDSSTLGSSFSNCWGAFVVTNFYDSVSGS